MTAWTASWCASASRGPAAIRLGDELERWTFGAFYGLPGETLRLMLNYEYRLLRDDLRQDDKLYVWLQVVF